MSAKARGEPFVRVIGQGPKSVVIEVKMKYEIPLPEMSTEPLQAVADRFAETLKAAG